MASGLEGLSHEQVEQIVALMRALEQSPFEYLEVKVGGLAVTLAKSGAAGLVPRAPGEASAARPTPPPSAPAVAPQAAPPPEPAPAAAAPAPNPPSPPRREPSGEGVVITAPLAGRFYTQSEPGAPPYVTVGSKVEPETTVGLIEVMKTYHAVAAGVHGTVRAVLAENAQFVEFGQPLYEVIPE
ncbi:MAG: hypothetical protein K6U14_12065 [Firmicutes bacterium]|nr:hypothetical protein [Alicyclobacillaceae bacterium]MCL6498348.1 hypothetical protein [Bacillota bacterium]